MMQIEKVRTSGAIDIQVSTASDLPALNTELGTHIVVKAGSIAQIVQTGEWATLDDDGKWYNSDGTGEV